VLSSQDLVAFYAGTGDILTVEISFQGLFVECAFRMSRICLPEQRFFLQPISYERKRSCYQPGSGITDVQMCHYPTNIYKSNDVCRAGKHILLKRLVGSISEGDQKKNGNQPKPGKPKPEKPKPDRKDDKGSQRVKRPKIEGPVLHSM
jgi:hypothetical protein